MKVKFFDYPRQFTEFEDTYVDIIKDTFIRGQYILGPELESFEQNLAEFVGAEYAIGVGNGTDGILLSLYAAGIGLGDEVISVSHTFVATIEVIVALGANPVFVDIADDHNMDVDQVKSAITSRTKAIVPVQLNGRICSNMGHLVEIAEAHNLIIIEDAAQSIGAKYGGATAGTFGMAGCYSFYPAKILGTFGDAGAIITDDTDLALRLRMIRNHGRGEHGEVELWGLNSRMDNVHAAILNYRLTLLDKYIDRRREIARIYNDGLSGISELRLPPPPEEEEDHFDVFQNYEIEVENRDGLADYLGEKGIEVAVQWGGKGVHQFKALGLGDVKLPRTEELFRKALLLPIDPGLEDEQVDYVIQSIRQFTTTT